MNRRLSLRILNEEFSICRLDPSVDIPVWVRNSHGFLSITRTNDELSIVAASRVMPDDVDAETGWRAIKVEGPLEFTLTGILSSIASPLADAGISIFAVSTFDTDYILVKSENLMRTVEILGSDHTISGM